MDLIKDSDSTLMEGVEQFLERMKKNFSTATKYLHRAQKRMKSQADQKRREQRSSSGDQVLLSTEHLQLKNAPVRKLRKRFIGPFFVSRQVGTVAYELELPKSWRIHNVFHVSLLRPFRTSQWTQPTTAGQVEDLEPEDDEPYEVEKLLRWRWTGPSTKRQKEYLVLWKNYSIDDASWTPADHFTYPEELKKMEDRDQPAEDN